MAAGTCACGRALAQYAASVTCLDATPAMLAEVGGLRGRAPCNMAFVEGVAGALPFGESAFDIVVSRLALHHIAGSQGGPLRRWRASCARADA